MVADSVAWPLISISGTCAHIADGVQAVRWNNIGASSHAVATNLGAPIVERLCPEGDVSLGEQNAGRELKRDEIHIKVSYESMMCLFCMNMHASRSFELRAVFMVSDEYLNHEWH
jgi:hypothetical protein